MHELSAVATTVLSGALALLYQFMVAGVSLLAGTLVLYCCARIVATAYFNALFRHILRLDEHYKGNTPNGL